MHILDLEQHQKKESWMFVTYGIPANAQVGNHCPSVCGWVVPKQSLMTSNVHKMQLTHLSNLSQKIPFHAVEPRLLRIGDGRCIVTSDGVKEAVHHPHLTRYNQRQTAMKKDDISMTHPNTASPLAHVCNRAPLVCVRVVTFHAAQAGRS